MSPHQRVLIAAASTVKSRPIRSGRRLAFGSATVVTCHRRGLLPQIPAARIRRAMRLRPCRAILAHQDNKLQDDATVLFAEWRSPAPADSEPVAAPTHHLLQTEH
jgi:hypothetical protein